MTGERDEALGRLTDELAEALSAGESVVPAAWAARFAVDEADVAACLRALQLLDQGLGEEPSEGPPELPAPRLPEDYELLGEIGRGGMGVVYRARQRSLDRDVAIKVLRPGDLVFGDALRRFRAEAKNLARLRHRHIVSVHDLGENPDGTLWFAMDLIDGTTLADEAARRRRVTPARAVRILRQVASAIAHAHAHGIVHRDRKPQNVLIDRDGDAFVVDFGLARDAAAAGTRTLSGELLGTPAYMSPEQARGDATRIGEPTDVWALGALLYELSTGRGPFRGKPLHETIRAILEDDPPRPRSLDANVPAELEAVCLKALQKRPEDRYPTALAFAEDLERFADGRGVLARAPGRLHRAVRWLGRRRRAAVAVVAAAAVTAVSLVAWLPSLRRDIVVGEAERLLGAGHAAAAIASLSPMLAELAPQADLRDRVELLLARAHNDVAAELLCSGEDATGPASAAAALAERRELDGGALPVERSERHAEWMWELLRARSMCEPGEVRPPFATAPLTARALTELRDGSSAHAGCAVWSMARARVPVAGLDDGTRLTMLRPLLLAAGRALEAGWHSVATAFPCHWTGADVDAWWSPAVESRLVELATDDGLPAAARAVAFRAFCQLVALPAPPLPTARSDAGGAPDFGDLAVAAQRTIGRWRAMASLPDAERLAARVDLLVEAHERRGELFPGCEDELPRLVSEATGIEAPGDDTLAEWWRQRRQVPFHELLRRSAGLPPETTPDPIDALDRSAATHEPLAMVWRQLTWLQLPPGAAVPRCDPRTSDGGIAWRARCLDALGLEDPRHFVVDVAVAQFVNGAAVPELVHVTTTTARLGARAVATLDTTIATVPLFTRRRPWQDERARQGERWVRWDLHPIPGEVPLGTCVGKLDAHLVFDSGGVRLRGGGLLQAHLPQTSYTGRTEGAADVRLGTAACFDSLDIVWNDGAEQTTLQLLVAVRETEDARTLGFEGWRSAAARRFVVEATSRTPTTDRLDWILPAWWSLPDAAEALRQLAQREGPRALQHAALQLAGVSRGTGLWPSGHYRIPQSLRAVHIAAATPSPDVRAEVLDSLAELEPAAFRPGIVHTLREAAERQGFALPAALDRAMRTVQDEAEGLGALLRDVHVSVLFFVCAAAFLLHRGRSVQSRVTAWNTLAWLVVLVGFGIRAQWHGVVLTPSYALIGLATALVASAHRDWPWYRKLGLAALLAYTAWAALSWWAVVAPPTVREGFLLSLLLLTGMWWRTPARGRRTSAARAGRADGPTP